MSRKWQVCVGALIVLLLLPALALGGDMFYLYGRTFHDLNSNGVRDDFTENFDDLFVCLELEDGSKKCGTTDASEYQWDLEEHGVYVVSVDLRQELLQGFAITSVSCTVYSGEVYPCEIAEWYEDGALVGYKVAVEFNEETVENAASVNFGFELFTPAPTVVATDEPSPTATLAPVPTVTGTAQPTPTLEPIPEIVTIYFPVWLHMSELNN